MKTGTKPISQQCPSPAAVLLHGLLKQSQEPTLSPDSTVPMVLQSLAALPGYLLPQSSVSSFSTFLERKEKTAYLTHPSLGEALFLTKHFGFSYSALASLKRVLGNFRGTAAPG